jgi:(E)-4-hydroxy-3-methylbut-2-enyl-diphosphate synthase
MNTKEITIGNVKIGGTNPVAIQSMTNTYTKDIEATVSQIHALEEKGCEIVRVAVPDEESAHALKEIKKRISIPLVADIHFDYRLAIIAAEHVDKLRINPGNIGSEEKVRKVLEAAQKRNIPIRVGVNLGSLDKELRKKYGATPKAMVESAKQKVAFLENFGFTNIVVSLKSSDIRTTVEAYTLFSKESHYPLHVGITEAGTKFSGTIKSAVGIGSILLKGIGNTIRVSLTDSPLEEIDVGLELLKSIGLKTGRTIVSCPTCGRTKINLIGLAQDVEEKTKHIRKNLKIAVMGCVVNGPGEAKDADIGIAGGEGCGVIFKKGQVIKKVDEKELLHEFMKELSAL